MTPELAFYEAYDAGKRLPELEDIIMNNPSCCYLYAFYVIKGKLPEKMHNMMMLYAVKDPNNYYIKDYFEDTSK